MFPCFGFKYATSRVAESFNHSSNYPCKLCTEDIKKVVFVQSMHKKFWCMLADLKNSYRFYINYIKKNKDWMKNFPYINFPELYMKHMFDLHFKEQAFTFDSFLPCDAARRFASENDVKRVNGFFCDFCPFSENICDDGNPYNGYIGDYWKACVNLIPKLFMDNTPTFTEYRESEYPRFLRTVCLKIASADVRIYAREFMYILK